MVFRETYPETQDVLGQLPLLKAYTHLSLLFTTDAPSSVLTTSLRLALQTLLRSIPWLAGRVAHTERSATHSGVFTVVRHRPFEDPSALLTVTSLHSALPTMSTLLATKCPSASLPGNLLSRRIAFPISYDDAEPAPVLDVQLSLVAGGAILNVAAQHNMLDMSGIAQTLRLLSQAMRGEEISREALDAANLDRRTLVPLLQRPSRDHAHVRVPSKLNAQPVAPKASQVEDVENAVRWHTLRGTPESLAALKAHVSLGVPEGEYVTTDDALCALLWRAVTAARLQRGAIEASAPTKYCRAIDCRAVLGITGGYMGDCVTNAHCSGFTAGDVEGASLARLALALRAAIKGTNEREYVRSFATLVAQTQDKSTIAYAGLFKPEADVATSSWVRADVGDLDFGEDLGRVRMVRRPDFFPVSGLVYFLPRQREGEVDVLLGLGERDGKVVGEMVTEWLEYVG